MSLNKGVIKPSETNFNAFLELEKRKEMKRDKVNQKAAADQVLNNNNNKENINEKKAKKKTKASSATDSPKAKTPVNFEKTAKEVCSCKQ